MKMVSVLNLTYFTHVVMLCSTSFPFQPKNLNIPRKMTQPAFYWDLSFSTDSVVPVQASDHVTSLLEFHLAKVSLGKREKIWDELITKFLLVARTGGSNDFKIPGTSRSSVGEVEIARREAPSVNPTDILSKWEEDNLLREYLSVIFLGW